MFSEFLLYTYMLLTMACILIILIIAILSFIYFRRQCIALRTSIQKHLRPADAKVQAAKATDEKPSQTSNGYENVKSIRAKIPKLLANEVKEVNIRPAQATYSQVYDHLQRK